MKLARTLSLVVAMLFCAASFSLGAGWNLCKDCHDDGNAPAQSKETLLKKFKTAEALIEAAKASESPMMNSFKKDDQLKAAATDLGLK
jgi:hypothetical protein